MTGSGTTVEPGDPSEAAPDESRWAPPLQPRLRAGGTGVAALVVLGLVGLVAAQGGYFAESWGWSATAFQAAAGDPTPLPRCQRGAWQDRRLGAPGRSRLTLLMPCTKGMHRVWTEGHARRACPRAACTVLVQWHGFQPHASGCVPLSSANFSL